MRKYLGGTDEDPIDYLKSHGISEAQFRIDVQRAYNNGEIMETTGEGSPVVHARNYLHSWKQCKPTKGQEQIMV